MTVKPVGNDSSNGTAGQITGISNQIVSVNSLVSSADSSGTYAYTNAGLEQVIFTIVTTTRKIIEGIWLDLVNMTHDGTIKIYYKIDGTNYREIDSIPYNILTDSPGAYISINMGITNDFRVTYTEGADEGVARNISYSIIYRTVE